jgi:hypothetical protein
MHRRVSATAFGSLPAISRDMTQRHPRDTREIPRSPPKARTQTTYATPSVDVLIHINTSGGHAHLLFVLYIHIPLREVPEIKANCEGYWLRCEQLGEESDSQGNSLNRVHKGPQSTHFEMVRGTGNSMIPYGSLSQRIRAP